MDNSVTVKGIIAGSFPYGEYGKRLIILTDQFGKISVFAKGIAKTNSKLIGASRIFTLGEFTLTKGKEAYTLIGAKVLDSFSELTADADSAFLGQYVMEAGAYFLREGIPEKDAKSMLNLIYVTLSALRNKKIPEGILRRIFELRLLKEEGIYTEHPVISTEDSEACWKYTLGSPLSALYDPKKWSECGTEEFCESVRRLMEEEVPHRFLSAELL